MTSKYIRLVQVSIEFLSIGEIDTIDEKFDAEVRIKSTWCENEDLEVYDRNEHWYPKLFIANAMSDVVEEIKYNVARFDSKSIITETRIARGNFWER
jgi:hypothetical protein